MDLVYLKKLLKLLDDSDSHELFIEEEGTKIKISKGTKASQFVQVPSQPIIQAEAQQTIAAHAQASQAKLPAAEILGESDPNEGMHILTSPIVGTFYSAPSPESPVFVEVGSKVTAGQTLCIIEAMKLMNEIESDIAGTIEQILVQNGSPIEFNQPLFVIKPD